MKRNLVWHKDAWADYLYWQKTNKRLFKRVNSLIEDIWRDSPFTGIGKPEPLKENLTGYWSRRIDEVHRLIYTVTEEHITVIACRYHY